MGRNYVDLQADSGISPAEKSGRRREGNYAEIFDAAEIDVKDNDWLEVYNRNGVVAACGGTHNTPTRIHMKPTHMIGGYGQLSYGFNYYGSTENQRDIYIVARKME